MTNLVGKAKSLSPKTSKGGEVTSCHRAALPSHNLSMTMDDTISAGWPVTCVGKRDSIPLSIVRVAGRRGPAVGLNPSMLLNLRSKGRAGSCADWNDSGNTDPESSSRVRTATFRRAEFRVPANVDRRGQAPRGAATFLSIWLMRLGLVGRVTRPATRRTAVKLGGGSNLRSLTATGNMTRYERFGVTPKAIRFPLDRMADLLEEIC